MKILIDCESEEMEQVLTEALKFIKCEADEELEIGDTTYKKIADGFIIFKRLKNSIKITKKPKEIIL